MSHKLLECIKNDYPSGPRCIFCDEPFIDGRECHGRVGILESKNYGFALFILKQGRINAGKIIFTINDMIEFDFDIYENECQGIWFSPKEYHDYLENVQNLCLAGTLPVTYIFLSDFFKDVNVDNINLKYKFLDESYKNKIFTVKIYSLIDKNLVPISWKKMPSDKMENMIEFQNLQILSKRTSENCCGNFDVNDHHKKKELTQSVISRISKMS